MRKFPIKEWEKAKKRRNLVNPAQGKICKGMDR